MTEWRPIPSIPNHSASSVGQVRNDITGTIRKASTTQAGYMVVAFHRSPKKICRLVHLLVCEAFHGLRPAGAVCRHLDGNRLNNAAENLRWGTHAENMADRDAHGRTSRGNRNGNRTMSSADVTALVADYAAGGVTQYELAARYGISQAQVNNIVLGKQWGSVHAGPIGEFIQSMNIELK